MSVELHLPDLPEVPISLGPAPTRPGSTPPPKPPWSLRVRDALSSYLPLLLMTLLALATWWLVKNAPSAPRDAGERPLRHEPDYTMTGFAVERFDATGRLKVRLEGDRLRHYPDDDRIEVDQVRIRAIAPDGRVTLASARRALANGDASEVQLLGAARVTSVDADGQPVEMSGEFLHAYLVTERVRSHLPVRVDVAGSQVQAAGLDYDHGQRRLVLDGPIRGVFPPRKAVP